MPVLLKVPQVMVLKRHKSADSTAAARANFPGICSDRMRKMNTRGAAMQGDEHKAARNLSRACTARVHARRLARASRVV